MARHRLAPLLLLAALLSPVLGQSKGAGQFGTGSLQVRVTFPDGRRCTIPVHVQLMAGASSNPVAEAYTNDSGMAQFSNVALGNYHLVVSGQGIQDADSGTFEIDNRRQSQYQYVTVIPSHEAKSMGDDAPVLPMTAATDLNIPAAAAKEFDRASDFMTKQEWAKALERLNKALAIYSQYAAAYNNLAVVYARLGDRPHAREALQKAVAFNDHFVPGFVNLAWMDITDRNFGGAEALLDKANTIDPSNPHTLALLSNVELLNRHYDAAIANGRKVHSLSKEPHALVHYIAARSLERENRPSEAIDEFQVFLQEEPSGPRADAVRKELSGLGDKSH
jgi:tetratricopeptide (TPR) repeat protein